MAYFFAALALGLLGGIKTHLIIVAILMALILASLWVGDHPALMRRNRNQTVTLDRAISNESELITSSRTCWEPRCAALTSRVWTWSTTPPSSRSTTG